MGIGIPREAAEPRRGQKGIGLRRDAETRKRPVFDMINMINMIFWGLGGGAWPLVGA